MKCFPIDDLSDFSVSDGILVVGIIGKSTYKNVNKAHSLLGKIGGKECKIECQWNDRQKVLYLHLTSLFDTVQLTSYIQSLTKQKMHCRDGAEGVQLARESGDFLVAAGDITTEVAKSLLLMFHLCHIILLSFPTPVFDLNYVHLFKAIDALRLEIQSTISEKISNIVDDDWAHQARPCCPRVLFYFDSCPRQLKTAEVSRLKKFEHSIEDQIYHILRKARIITNISSNSLFAIPKNEEFVYVHSTSDSRSCNILDMLRCLVLSCDNATSQPPSADWTLGPLKAAAASRVTLAQFVTMHIDIAFTHGFDDNVGKFANATPSIFVVPPASVWRDVAKSLTKYFLSDDFDKQHPSLWDSLCTEIKFSQARCAKVLPIAQASYTEGLPNNYASLYHEQKVSVAVGVFWSMARGPLCTHFRTQLEETCAGIWQSRRLCEKLSLTGNPCIKPKHGEDSPSDSPTTESEHSSGVRYVNACNCGRSKGAREDPYTVRRANCNYYETLAKDCVCGNTLLIHSFPVFQPSIDDFKAALIKPGAMDLRSDSTTAVSQKQDGEGSQTQTATLAGGTPHWSDDDGEPVIGAVLTSRSVSRAPVAAEPFQYQLSINESSTKDKALVRQPSTTEYLPGMLHTESPPGLLPAFSSWSLVCLGASSLYSHTPGLPEHLHPGLLPHTNFLLPWDCAVRVDQLPPWRSVKDFGSTILAAGGRPVRGKPPLSQLTVKIFLGLEYECPRGHRFMMATPDSVVNGNTITKETGAKVANTDMPIYHHCPCRSNKPMLGQLMRVHVVSPKAPVHITLNPKVQPAPGSPIFIPGGETPIKLTSSTYWILRLPYIYASEQGPLPRPTAPLSSALRGRLLAGMIGVSD